MTSPRGHQQRLFTGALFPEALNAQLYAFAARHGLQSNVWVPRKAFEAALKPYGIFILPTAALCDVSLAPGGGVGEVTEAIGSDRVLVNAEHTSNQHLMERFREFLTSRLTTPVLPPMRLESWPIPHALLEDQRTLLSRDRFHHVEAAASSSLPYTSCADTGGREYFSAVDGPSAEVAGGTADAQGSAVGHEPDCILQPEPQWDNLPPFQHPLALNGSLILGTEVASRLLQWQQQGHHYSNYWRRLYSASSMRQRYFHTGNTEYPGRYNPYFCVRYIPHNYTAATFPSDIARLMRHRAVEYGYVSRLWLTKLQGEKFFGSHLLPKRATDFPPIFCSTHTGGLECIAYYCADQFADSAELFPSRREIDLAAKGVWTASAKIAAYPLLRKLQAKYSTETAHAGGERAGVDVAMRDATRHTEFCEVTEAYKTIRLVGYTKKAKEMQFLEWSGLEKALQRQCILCGYPTPVFISLQIVHRLNLPLRSGEEGVVQTRCPTQLSYRNAWISGDCWFNVAQLIEPAVGAELLHHWPRHFLSRQRLHGELAAQCCRLQITGRACDTACPSPATSNAASDTTSCEWVPLFLAKVAGWKVKPGAAGVPYKPYASRSFNRYAITNNVFYRLADVLIDAETVDWVRRYTPVDAMGRAYLRGLRQLLTLRALERGYKMHKWISLGSDAKDHVHLPLRATPAPVRPGVSPLDASQYYFSQPPFVRFRSRLFVNVEELQSSPSQGINDEACAHAAVNPVGGAPEEPDAPLQQMKEKERDMVELGIGASAETLHVRERHIDDADLFEVAARSSTSEDVAEAELPVESFDDEDAELFFEQEE